MAVTTKGRAVGMRATTTKIATELVIRLVDTAEVTTQHKTQPQPQHNHNHNHHHADGHHTTTAMSIMGIMGIMLIIVTTAMGIMGIMPLLPRRPKGKTRTMITRSKQVE
jgi:hypothetical protein